MGMAKYTDRKTKGVMPHEIDSTDIAVIKKLLSTKKLTEPQRVAVQRLLSAWYSTD